MYDNIPVLNLYPDAIKNVIDVCREALEGCHAILNIYDTDIDKSKIDIDKEAIEYLNNNGKWSELTNSIITAYLDSTANHLQCKLFDELNISFEYYVNCDDSRLHMKTEKTTFEILESQDIIDYTHEAIIDKLDDFIKIYLKDQNKIYPRDYIEDDIRSEEILTPCIITEFIFENKIPDEYKEFINNTAKDNDN